MSYLLPQFCECNNRHQNRTLRASNKLATDVSAVRCELRDTNHAAALGITATGPTPVLALCRELLAAGVDPNQCLEVYRGATLALRIRSLGEAAALELNSEATGFRRRRQPDAAPPMRQNRRAAG
jgi:hypothetical protein